MPQYSENCRRFNWHYGVEVQATSVFLPNKLRSTYPKYYYQSGIICFTKYSVSYLGARVIMKYFSRIQGQ